MGSAPSPDAGDSAVSDGASRDEPDEGPQGSESLERTAVVDTPPGLCNSTRAGMLGAGCSVDAESDRLQGLRSNRTIAVCILGLQRSFGLIAGNTAQFLEQLKLMGTVHIFGVQPVNDKWPQVLGLLKKTALLENATIEPQMLVNLTPPARFTPQRSGRSFMIELWDCAHCFDMLNASEARFGRQYDVVARLRLDLYWELLPPMPSVVRSQHVHVPAMSGCQGLNDKFALGGRVGMELYLTRVHRLPFGPRDAKHGSFQSEKYLSMALRGASVVRHGDWMFCKVGDATNMSRYFPSNMWLECSLRILFRMRCERFNCGWCGQGCRCWNSTCTSSIRETVVSGRRLCHSFNSTAAKPNSTSTRKVPGSRVRAAQLLLSHDAPRPAHNCARLSGVRRDVCEATGPTTRVTAAA